jgi:hypothetical protein
MAYDASTKIYQVTDCNAISEIKSAPALILNLIGRSQRLLLLLLAPV